MGPYWGSVAAWSFKEPRATATPTQATTEEEPDAIARTAVFIGTPGPALDRPLPIGTGFLLSDGRFVVLVTARHVAQRTNPRTPVKLLAGDQPLLLTLGELAADPAVRWNLHDAADAAAIRLKSWNGPPLHVFKRSQVSVEPLPMRERPLVVYGFPLGIGSADFSPVSQQYNRASNLVTGKSDSLPQEAQYYLLDRPSIDGFSGAPVFQVPGIFHRGNAIVSRGDFIMVGLVAATLSDRTGGKLGAVVPPTFIAAVFDQAIASP